MDSVVVQEGGRGRTVVLPAADTGPLLVARRGHFPAGTRIATHRHVRGQFLFAASGTMFVRTPGRAWLIPPSRALWIPAGADHAIDAHGELHMRTLYLHEQGARSLPAACMAFEVTPLLRELVLRVTAPAATRLSPQLDLVAQLLIAEIAQLPRCRLELPMPHSADLLAWCERMLDPARGDAGRAAPGSAKTLYRRFRAETGISFVQWKRQAVLLHAVRLLGAGASVTRVALDLGYESPSAFTTMFRRSLGVTPRTFLSAPDARRAARPSAQADAGSGSG